MGYAKKGKRGRARKCRRQEGERESSLVRKTEKVGCEAETSSREKRKMWKTDSEEIKREKKVWVGGAKEWMRDAREGVGVVRGRDQARKKKKGFGNGERSSGVRRKRCGFGRIGCTREGGEEDQREKKESVRNGERQDGMGIMYLIGKCVA